MTHADKEDMSSSWNRPAHSAVPEGEPGSGTTPDQPDVASVSEVVSGAEPPPVSTEPATQAAPPTSKESPVTDAAPNLPKSEQQDIGENAGAAGEPSVKDDDVKLAAEAQARDNAARADNQNAPVIRGGDPRVGGEHFL